MSLRLGFDLDGVLADMDSALVHHAEALFGEALTRSLENRAADAEPASEATAEDAPGAGAPDQDDTPPLASRLHLSARQQRRLWQHVGGVENFWEGLEEIEPGVVARFAALAAERRWEIIFLTKRPATLGATSQVQSQRWLASKGFEFPSVYVVQGSRGRIADALGLDIVVDDRPENCLDVVVDSKARAILVWREPEAQVPATARRLGIGVVTTVGECLDILARVDNGTQQPGVMDRIKRFLGLDKAAGA